MFKTIDDFLIDHVFQRGCDFLRKTFGWSRRVPSAVGFMVISICYVPEFFYCILSGDTILCVLAVVIVVGAALKAFFLLRSEVDGCDDQQMMSMAFSPERLKEVMWRKVDLIYIVLLFPIWLSSFTLVLPGVNWVAGAFFGWTLALYFRACTDLPPGETRYAKLKWWLREFRGSFAPRPALTPSPSGH
jgi:hypothetical protein